ncbi:MAG: Nif3-like dinuclear metal center hexameric protein [Clostridium sp.]|jgi:dinuclear metal center YbgI/SA1388 family protein|uniref:Nif3-like dinuclear metal center hexameric protein n=1 Tax=Clostridium sp. TaxID=1506 RepID=UPI0025BA7AD7|nr:Nif3-like dinuclear metal center hexameric protein [Clostridium sp.]MCH3964669.1 Nif3-like dinuclear metal center hexameric protein [Clostridium sp.]MCI1715140.1 Nif3-like dinuclear metal center hexameric protein [Clostridium sp.]MCI1799402.1 Nif3-like dinuclear metal center hexameric protein [Clostridium sp.]MCI1813323.1 Nif3-like dinuclear metal center hexameric protein [Clostridium sp.]MCI1870214.1 Nif3-like dinuclear metal center hexameric protein [Clostridium sp.]
MPLKVKDIHDIMEQYAPSRLKEDYDNVGLMIGNMKNEVKSVLVSLDCTLEVIEEAKNNGCNLIFTHHPLLFSKPKSITTDTLTGLKIIKLIKNDINVYSSHTNLDSTFGGLNDIIMQMLNFKNSSIIEHCCIDRDYFTSHSGIGRFSELESSITLAELCVQVKEKLQIKHLRYVGDDNKIIKKVAVINGSGKDYFYKAKMLGADCIITGDTTYHYVSDFNEEGIAVIDAGHFGTEWPAISRVADYLKNRIEAMGFQNNVILSKTNADPYKYK